jgi:cellulose synthase/poly-beta-1,6-N-acetylglucosamine synthase-like glycosyltransferase
MVDMLLSMVNVVLWVAAGSMLIPAAVFCAECAAAMLARRSKPSLDSAKSARPRLGVLVPAHNEEFVLGRTLEGILAELAPGDRLLVVADNCNDATAAVARAAAAEVTERHDADRRGKGYALAHGFAALGDDPPEIVVVIDADCRLRPGSLDRLARAAGASGRPMQSLNLGEHPSDAGALSAVSALGLHFKNLIRPLGLIQFGGPCHLMGTGMAIPWSLVGRANLDEASVVEDMRLGIELALAGHPAGFEPEAEVTSPLPREDGAFVSQRTRWEHGHLHTLLAHVPRVAWGALRQRRVDLALLALDLAVPPLALLVTIWFVATAAATLAWTAGATVGPAALLWGTGAAMSMAVAGGWLVHCRRAIPWTTFLGIPWYVVRKLPIYAAFLTRPQKEWVRTPRQRMPTRTVSEEAAPAKSRG